MPEIPGVGVPSFAVFSSEEPGSNVTQGSGLRITALDSSPFQECQVWNRSLGIKVGLLLLENS